MMKKTIKVPQCVYSAALDVERTMFRLVSLPCPPWESSDVEPMMICPMSEAKSYGIDAVFH